MFNKIYQTRLLTMLRMLLHVYPCKYLINDKKKTHINIAIACMFLYNQDCYAFINK